jgi:hypothetical protein
MLTATMAKTVKRIARVLPQIPENGFWYSTNFLRDQPAAYIPPKHWANHAQTGSIPVFRNAGVIAISVPTGLTESKGLKPAYRYRNGI